MRSKPHEVIVVDSNSENGTARLKDLFPIVFLSIPERNREYARNLGISVATGEIVAFLDDDVIVDEDWLDQIARLYERKDVGGVGGRVIPYGACKKHQIAISNDCVGKVFDNGLVLGNFDLSCEEPAEVDSFIGCNMSFRRVLLLAIGGFDECYEGTGYRDDTDISLRIRGLRYKLLYSSEALVWHKFRGKRLSGTWSYWYVRNHVYFYFKNLFPKHKFGFFSFLYHMFVPPRDYVQKSGVKIKIEPNLALNVFKGFFDGLRIWRHHNTHAG
jgi:hypothetical protein